MLGGMPASHGPRRRPSRRHPLRDDERARLIYRDPEFLRQFLTERGRVRPRSATGLGQRDQTRLARAVKLARELALLPYAQPAQSREPRR